MIVNVKRKELLMQAKKVARAAPYTSSVKELSGILFEADERTGVVRMTATDLHVSIRSVLPASVEKDGSAVIDARLFLGILDRLPGESVYMELKDNGQLYFGSENAKFLIAVLNGNNYPKVEIPYTDMAGARKFFTRESAQAFIDAELPENAKSSHTVVEMDRYSLLILSPEDYAKLLEWEQNRRISKVMFRINPEDSKGADIIEFYNRLADICGLDPSAAYYDCRKIHVSRNIQSNIFEVLDAKSSDPCYTGMMWCLRGPKTFDELPDDTVELLDGFFTTHDEKPLPFIVKINNADAA